MTKVFYRSSHVCLLARWLACPGMCRNEKIYAVTNPQESLALAVCMQGISSHFEDTRSFGDAIMTISLLSPIYMTLKQPAVPTNQCQDIIQEHKILLRPRSCLIMSGEARYKWRHGISKAKNVCMPDGSNVYRGSDYRRLSLTIRQVLDGRRRAEQDTQGWLRHATPVMYSEEPCVVQCSSMGQHKHSSCLE